MTSAAPARFGTQAVAILQPGCCSVCNGIAGPFIDTFQNERGNRIYICQACITEMAGLILPVPEPVTVEVGPSPETINDLRNLVDSINAGLVPFLDAVAILDADSHSEEIPGDPEADSEGDVIDPEQGDNTSKRKGRVSVPSDSGDGNAAGEFDLSL